MSRRRSRKITKEEKQEDEFEKKQEDELEEKQEDE